MKWRFQGHAQVLAASKSYGNGQTDMVTTASEEEASQEQLTGATLVPLTVEGPKGGRMSAAGAATTHSASSTLKSPRENRLKHGDSPPKYVMGR